MAKHEIVVPKQEAKTIDVSPGDLFQDVSECGGGRVYMVVSLGTDLALVCLGDGILYKEAGDDPFAGDRADFQRIPGNRKITIE